MAEPENARREPTLKDIRRTAFHEAGHAAMAWALGCNPGGVYIGAGGGGCCGCPGYGEPGRPFDIVITMGGWAGEEVGLAHPPPAVASPPRPTRADVSGSHEDLLATMVLRAAEDSPTDERVLREWLTRRVMTYGLFWATPAEITQAIEEFVGAFIESRNIVWNLAQIHEAAIVRVAEAAYVRRRLTSAEVVTLLVGEATVEQAEQLHLHRLILPEAMEEALYAAKHRTAQGESHV